MAARPLAARDLQGLVEQRDLLASTITDVDLQSVSREELFAGHTADWQFLWKHSTCQDCRASVQHCISWIGDGNCAVSHIPMRNVDHGNASDARAAPYSQELAVSSREGRAWASQLVVVSQLAFLAACHLAMARKIPVSEATAVYLRERGRDGDGDPPGLRQWRRISSATDFASCLKQMRSSSNRARQELAQVAEMHVDAALRHRGCQRGIEDPAASKCLVIVRAWPADED
jgi:hypothetical protein